MQYMLRKGSRKALSRIGTLARALAAWQGSEQEDEHLEGKLVKARLMSRMLCRIFHDTKTLDMHL